MVDVRDIAVRLRRRRRIDVVSAGVCRAPFTSMYLDQLGSVRACCQNSDHPLGNVTTERLRDIWASTSATALREAMLRSDLDLGCHFCKWQTSDGNESLVFARTFDHLAPDSLEPAWPRQLELSMSNACNLQCEMCNGDWSSSIRANREGRPPLPQVYDEQFFDDLRPFLEHVEIVKCLGGEPFLGRESLRVMEMLIEMGSTAAVHVTTNATQWSPRVERILERLPMTIVVSLDGVDASTYESIRIGARFEDVMRNLDRFSGYAQVHGTAVHLAHCLMTSNWEHFPAFLRFAEARGMRAYVNTVTSPIGLSLFHLPPQRLKAVIDHLEAHDADLSRELTLNLPLWRDQLLRLHHRLNGLVAADGVDYYLGVSGFPLARLDGGDAVGVARGQAATAGPAAATHLRVDLDQRVQELMSGPSEIAGIDLGSLVGNHLEQLVALYRQAVGPASYSTLPETDADVQRWRMVSELPASPVILGFIAPTREDGVIVEFQVFLAVLDGTDAVAPSIEAEAQLAAFTARNGDVTRIDLGHDGRVLRVDAAPTRLGAVLESATGTSAADLSTMIAEHLGEIVSTDSQPVGGDAVIHRLSLRGPAGDVRHVEALALPAVGLDAGPTLSIVHVADVPPGVNESI